MPVGLWKKLVQTLFDLRFKWVVSYPNLAFSVQCIFKLKRNLFILSMTKTIYFIVHLAKPFIL